MRKISYGINSYNKVAHIYIEYGSFLIFWLEWIFDWICFLIPGIPFPPIPMKLKDSESIEFNDNKKWTNLREWYGDLNSWFCVAIHNRISDYCWKRIDCRDIKVDYNELKKATYDKEKRFWDDNIEAAKGIDNEKD